MSLDHAFVLVVASLVGLFLLVLLSEILLEKLWRRIWSKKPERREPRFPWSGRTGQ